MSSDVVVEKGETMHLSAADRIMTTMPIRSGPFVFKKPPPSPAIKAGTVRKAPPGTKALKAASAAKVEKAKATAVVKKMRGKVTPKAIVSAADLRNKLDVVYPAESSYRETFAYPQAMVDSPSYWDSEFSYFGESPPLMPLGQYEVAGEGTVSPATDTGTKPWYADIATGITGALLSYKQQRDFDKYNLELAKAGRPPVNVQQYAATRVPAARVDVGISSTTQTMLIVGAVGLAGIFLVTQFFGKKRR